MLPSFAPLKRLLFVDHMRGFIFLLMAVDHALHAYAANWARYAFYRDYDRTYLFDALYLFNQSAIMPVLFFTFGAYVLPKVSALGLRGFWKDRFIKHIIPFVVGVPLIVPLLSYPKFHEYDDPGLSYGDYWQNIFLGDALQAGPYWVMYALILYTSIFLILNKLFPKIVPWVATQITKALVSPVKFFLFFTAASILIYGLSDLRWGAPWWIGLRTLLPDIMKGQLFSLQASKFLMNFVYFFLGAAFMASRAWEHKNKWADFTQKRFVLLGATLIVGLAYVLYAHFYFTDGAYDYSIYKTLRLGHETASAWAEAIKLVPQVAPAILIRTSLMGLLAFLQVLTLLAFFSHQPKGSKWYAVWASAASCCWGIFIIHDPLMIWGQFLLTDLTLHFSLKFICVAVSGIGLSWLLTQALLKVKYLQRIFERD